MCSWLTVSRLKFESVNHSSWSSSHFSTYWCARLWCFVLEWIDSLHGSHFYESVDVNACDQYNWRISCQNWSHIYGIVVFVFQYCFSKIDMTGIWWCDFEISTSLSSEFQNNQKLKVKHHLTDTRLSKFTIWSQKKVEMRFYTVASFIK